MDIIPTTDERNVIYPLMKIPEKKVLKKSEWERLSKLLTLNNKFQFSLIFLDKIVSGRQYIDFAKEQHVLEETFTYQSQKLSLIPHSSVRVSIYWLEVFRWGKKVSYGKQLRILEQTTDLKPAGKRIIARASLVGLPHLPSSKRFLSTKRTSQQLAIINLLWWTARR